MHRHIYGKWACRCCQVLKQQPTIAEIIDAGLPASGLLAHTLISRFADHLPYYRQEEISVADGGSTAAAIDYTLKHWTALTHHLEDGAVPIDNNHLERQIKPWAMGRKAWMFVGSELAGQRAAVVMSLVQSARMCGREPWAYLRDVLQRLPTQLNSRIEDLLPHHWQSA